MGDIHETFKIQRLFSFLQPNDRQSDPNERQLDLFAPSMDSGAASSSSASSPYRVSSSLSSGPVLSHCYRHSMLSIIIIFGKASKCGSGVKKNNLNRRGRVAQRREW